MTFPKSKWDDELSVVSDLSGGVRSGRALERLQDKESPDLLNVNFQENVLQVDSGFLKFHNVVRGIPQRSIEFTTASGAKYHLLVTTATVYVGSNSADEWQYVSNGTKTTTTAISAAGSSTLAVTSNAAFNIGDFIGVTLANGKQHRTTVTAKPAGQLTMANAVPVGTTVQSGVQVVEAVSLAGNLDFHISFVPWPASDWLIFTNGVDPIKKFDGVDCLDLGGTAAVNLQAARELRAFHGHLLAFDVTELGTRYPQRIRRSNGGNPETWNAGTAGMDSLLDTDDRILQVLPLGPYLIVYRERSVMRGSYTGDAANLIFWEYTIQDKGAISNRSAVQVDAYHVVVSRDGVFRYEGGYDMPEIGEQIYNMVFSHAGDMNTPFRQRTFVENVPELNEVWIVYPASSQEIPAKLIRYNITFQSFWVRDLPIAIAGLGYYVRQNTQTWQSLVGSWLEQRWAWSSRTIVQNSPTILLQGADSQVYEYNYLTPNDDGRVIPFHYSTKNFTNPQFDLTVDHLVAFGRGSEISVDISVDGGQTWRVYGTFDFGPSRKRAVIWKQVTGDQFMYRFHGEDPLFQLSWWGQSFVETTE